MVVQFYVVHTAHLCNSRSLRYIIYMARVFYGSPVNSGFCPNLTVVVAAAMDRGHVYGTLVNMSFYCVANRMKCDK